MTKNSGKFKQDIENAIDCLERGGLILYPTDTIWGIGCDASNSEAVKKIYRLKQRADEKSMLVLTDSIGSLKKIVKEIPGVALELIEKAENPLTIIYNNAENVASNLIARDGSLGVRITNEEFSNELCRRFGKPIVSTSANISGEQSPKRFSDISEEIKSGVDYVVGYRQEDVSEVNPSNIVKIEKDCTIKVIR